MSRAIITGCPRSGTGYVAAVLLEAGIHCGHEEVYGPEPIPRAWGSREVESSWLALRHLPVEGVPAALQVRDPLAVIRSVVGIELPQRTGSRYRAAALALFPELSAEPSPVAWAARLWIRAVERARTHARAWWRVEDLRLPGGATQLAQHVGADPDLIAGAAARVPTDVNHRDRAEVNLYSIPRPLFADLQRTADRYGYAVAR